MYIALQFLCMLFILLMSDWVSASQSPSVREATVFVRVLGRVQVEYEGIWKEAIEEGDVEIATGSAFLISPYGHALTNYHLVSGEEIIVIVDGTEYKVTLEVEGIDVALPESVGGGGQIQRLPATVEAVDAELDLAVLSIGGSDLPYVPLGDSDAIEPGQHVAVLGFPFGKAVEVGGASFQDIVPQVSFSQGTLSALRHDEEGRPRYIQTDAMINPGNSGGPMVDEDGYALGVIYLKLKTASGIGFAIPINLVKDFLETYGLDWVFPGPRLQLGQFERLESKGLGLRFPIDFVDVSSGILHVDTRDGRNEVALRIDRVASTWSMEQLEKALLKDGAFEEFSNTSSVKRRYAGNGKTRFLLGHATGMATDGKESFKLEYGIVDMGTEKLVARWLGPAAEIAFNLGVIRNSLASLQIDALLTSELRGPVDATWVEVPFPSEKVPFGLLPAGWAQELSGPFACRGLSPFDAAYAAFPEGDFTVSFRIAWWRSAVENAEQASAACAPMPGSEDNASYESNIERLGINYAVEGIFIPVGEELLQLEVVSPVAKRRFVRSLFSKWVKAMRTEIEPARGALQ